MESLFELRRKVEILLHRFSAAKSELRSKDNALGAKDEEISMLRRRLQNAEDALTARQIGKAIPDALSREQVRQKLDEVISEIDKILTLHD